MTMIDLSYGSLDKWILKTDGFRERVGEIHFIEIVVSFNAAEVYFHGLCLFIYDMQWIFPGDLW